VRVAVHAYKAGAYLLGTFVALTHIASGQALMPEGVPGVSPGAPPHFAPAAQFKTDTRVVLVPTTVMNRKGAIVSGLTSDAFDVSQDNRPQQITSFGEEDVPVSLGIVLDVSGSMQHVLGEAKHTLRAFFSATNPEDEAFLYTVAGRPNRESAFTRDFDTLLDQALFKDAGGSTALVDTIYAALVQTRKSHEGRKAILVISDGMDNHSRYSAHELMSAAVEADLQIYSISVFDPPRNKKPIELQEERNGVAFLDDLTRKTGGVSLVVRDSEEATRAADRIARIMRDQYLLGYVPGSAPAPDSGKWHSIKVAVRVPDTQAYARSGYYSK
jgi:Ca-activated chloride channel family protein